MLLKQYFNLLMRLIILVLAFFEKQHLVLIKERKENDLLKQISINFP